MKPTLTPLSAALLVAVFQTAYAAPTPAPEASADAADSAKTLDAIQVTASRRSELASEVPQAVTVIGKEDLKGRVAQTNADLLRGEIGAFVQQTTPGQAVVIVRGLKGSEVLHMVDGFRLNNAFFRNAPNQYPALIDPLMIEQVEVLRGPASVLYGSDAMGGVVQMLSAKPTYGLGFSGRAQLRTASADSSMIARTEVNYSSDQFYAHVGATHQDVDNLEIGGGSVLPFTNYTARFANAKFGWAINESHELVLNTQFGRQPRTPRYDELVPGFGQTRPTSAEFLFRPQERYFASLKHVWDINNAWADRITTVLGRQDIVDDRLNRDFGTLNRDIEENTSEMIGVSTQFEKSIGDHYLSFGVERYEDEITSSRIRQNVATNAFSARPSRFPNGSTMDSTGIYFSDDWQLSSALDVIYGLRYSRFDIELPPVINNTGVSLNPNKVTGNLGINYEVATGFNVIANYGRGFRAPNVFDLGSFGTRPGNRFNIPNSELNPETVDTIDAGIKFQQGAWSGEIIAYSSRYDDKITSVETGERTATNQIIVQNQNATRLNLHGFEAGLRYDSDVWSGYLTSTLTRGTEQFGTLEYDADRIPPLFGKAGVDYRYNDAWTLSAYSYFAERQDRLSPRDVTDPRINPNGTAGFAIFNVAANWEVSEQLQLRLSLENLADKRYREHGTGLDEAGRNIGLMADWSF